MSDIEVSVKAQKPSLAKGLLSGLIGGLAATAAKSLAEKVYSPQTHDELKPPQLLAEKLAGGALNQVRQFASGETINWTFGAVAGATYGAVVEYYPAAAAQEGASFGVALETFAHEGALPALGLATESGDKTLRERTSDMGTHVIFGLVTEIVRKSVRRLL